MKPTKILAILSALILVLSACGTEPENPASTPTVQYDAVEISLSDEKITVDGKAVGEEETSAVYVSRDIVYYESGKDFTYGEGSEKDAHSVDEAAAHTVVNITKAGAYSISGKLSCGQIAVDLGEEAEENPEAVVTLILNGADVTCQVAPAVIFYNVYECGSDDTKKASKDVDTSAAGANVVIADGTVNNINGSYVERIYKPESVVLNDDKTEVEDADKLHKYDGAFYSKMSMNINGDKENTGVLNINAENEGLDSELHLTINGGNININSGNDGINTNEDEVSVTTVNGGTLKIKVTGETGEGDGIDSNGWLVINGGTVIASACSDSADAGIDSDMGIHINGGTVISSGHMLDRIEDGGQTYAVFNFAQKQKGSEKLTLKNADGKAMLEHTPENAYSVLIYSSPDLTSGTYTLWSDGNQLAGYSGGMVGGHGMHGMKPDGEMTSEHPEGMEPPTGDRSEPPTGEMPTGEMPQDRPEPPSGEFPTGEQEPPTGEGGERPEKPDDERWNPEGNTQELTTDFVISDTANMFGGISDAD